MFEEMLTEDTKYLEEILTLFKVSKYKLSETPTRFKMIIHPEEFPIKTLHEVQELKTPVGIEVDLKNGVFLECLKAGSSRKKEGSLYTRTKATFPTSTSATSLNRLYESFSVSKTCVNFKSSQTNKS